MCPFTRFMSICSISNSIFTLTAIGIERYWKFFFFLNNLNLKFFLKAVKVWKFIRHSNLMLLLVRKSWKYFWILF
jgi:hypothetical protein